MKKTINITLNGLVFNIEEDAYERLNNYLESLKKHFGTQEYGKEVVNDIESRIAEQFSSKLKDRKTEVIGLNMIEDVIKSMGTLEDLTGDSKKQETETPKTGKKRLYRNPDDQIIAGVGSGIASYFDIDPLIPRLLFVVGLLSGGWGVLLYILMWIIVPEAKSNSEKLEMRGDAVNIANLEESRKKDSAGRVSMISYFVREVVYLIGRFFRALGPVIMTIAGLIMAGVSFVVVFGLTLLTIILLFNPNSPYLDPTVTQIFNGGKYSVVILAAYAGLIIPALVVLTLGISFIRRRNLFSAQAGVMFAAIWLAGALTFGFMTAQAAPQIEAAVKSIEEQPGISMEIPVTDFDSIVTERDQRVKITYGETFKVVATGSQNALDELEVEVENKRLIIEQDDSDFRICFVCINRPLLLEVTMPHLNNVNARNASRIEINNFPIFNELTLDGKGAARFDFSGTVNNLTLNLTNAARATLMGSGTNLKADLSNAASLTSTEFRLENIELKASNASRADIFVTKNLTVDASNAARINYTGNPTEEKINISNAARVVEQ